MEKKYSVEEILSAVQDLNNLKKNTSKISKFTNFKGTIFWDTSKPDGTPKKLLNIDRIKNLGWNPKIDLDFGISQTIKSFEKEYKF